MVVVDLLPNGILQQLVQPFAYGAALGIHPLAVLVVTIAGGALFGAVGLILAAPLPPPRRGSPPTWRGPALWSSVRKRIHHRKPPPLSASAPVRVGQCSSSSMLRWLST
jgi:hypothetical protein